MLNDDRIQVDIGHNNPLVEATARSGSAFRRRS
jgi:hypothetical protein